MDTTRITTSVRVAGNRVDVRVGIGGDDLVTVHLGPSLENLHEFDSEVSITWVGRHVRSGWIEWADEFRTVLGRGIHIARKMQEVRDDPDGEIRVAGDAELFAALSEDYVVAVYVAMKGGEPYYERGRELTGTESARIVDLNGLRRLAMRLSRESA